MERHDGPHRGATLADVASRAGVSTATVSRVLNEPGRVQPDTRARVAAAIEALGYRPNHSARALAAGRTGMIGAVIPTMENAIFARGIQAFQEALDETGHTLLVASSAYSEALERSQIEALVARGADGLLLIGRHRSAAVLDWLAKRRVPAVFAWATANEGYPLPHVGFDNRAAMRRLAEEVLALGHRRIGVVSAPTAANDRAADRLRGIRDAVANVEGVRLKVIETEYGYDEGSAAFAKLVSGSARPTVVMCGNDVLAAGAMREARRRGLAVPRDVSVTGFDDIEVATLLDPPLTTVHVPHREMGRQAAQALTRMARLRSVRTTDVELPTRTEIRGTLAPPASGSRSAAEE